MSISPASVEQGECYTMTVGTTATMTLDVQYTLKPPGGTTGTVQPIEGWPFIPVTPAGPPHAFICTSRMTDVGDYVFTAMKNTLNSTWVAVDARITVTPAPVDPRFEVTAAPASQTVGSGESASYTVTVTALHGFDQDVALSASGQGVTVALGSSSVTPSPTASTTMMLSASPGTYAVTVTGTGGGLTRTATVSLVVEEDEAVPQPTTFDIGTSGGCAGVDTMVVTVGNGANMSLDLQYTRNGNPTTGTIPARCERLLVDSFCRTNICRRGFSCTRR